VTLPVVTTTFIPFGATTVTDALPETPPRLAVTDTFPAVDPAVNVVWLPVAGATVPGAAVDHAAPLAATGFPYASVAVAVNTCEPPNETVAVDGETDTVATGPATIVSVCDPEVYPVADAVSVGVPALVSW